MSDTALEALLERANRPLQVEALADGREAILVPHGHGLEIIGNEPATPADEWIRETKSFHDGDSLSRYIQRFKTQESLLVANVNTRQIVCTLDYHQADKATPTDHSANWKVQFSEEFGEWQRFEGKQHTQEAFVEFIEENAGDVLSPDAAAMLELCRDFSAVQNVNFKSSKRLDNGDRQFQFQAETGTQGKLEIPTKITLNMPIFYGEEAVSFDAFFRYRISDGGLTLGYKFHRIKPVLDAAFKAAVHNLSECCGLDAFYGEA